MTTVRDNREGLDQNEEMGLDITPAEAHDLKAQQTDERMQETPAFQRARKSKEKPESAAHKSKARALNAMRDFFAKTSARDKSLGWRTKRFTDPDDLQRETDDFVNYCLEREIIPTWNMFAVWMDCDVQTLYAEENLSSECAGVLKKLRNRLFTILEQFSMQTEGNPAAPIFHEKAQYGLSDQQPLDINIHTDSQKQLSDREAANMIELTPDAFRDKA